VSVALVTGASSGIGAAFARALHRSGTTVVLCGRDEERLRRTIDGTGLGSVEVLVADLMTPSGLSALSSRLASGQRPIDLVVHAAGQTASLPFGVGPLQAERTQLQLNVVVTMEVLHAAVTAMSGRGGGAIITVGSTAAVWSLGSYAATKAWQANLAQAIADRAGETGVHSLLLSPGFTRTELHQRAGVDTSRVPRWMWLSPDVVAAEGLRALTNGRRTWIPTRRYRVLVRVMRLLPVRMRVGVIRHVAPLPAQRQSVGGGGAAA